MPVSRRHIPRVNNSLPKVPSPNTKQGVIHCRLPTFPQDSDVLFEVMYFMFSVICLLLQYVNIYKTNWWVPNSFTTTSIHLHLIDKYYALHLLVMLSRRVIASFSLKLNNCYGDVDKQSSRVLLVKWMICRLLLFMLVSVPIATICFTTIHILREYSSVYFFFLHYPLVAYVFLFGFKIRPLFCRSVPDLPIEATFCSTNAATPSGHTFSARGLAATVKLCHINPEDIREDAEMLKTDFNERVKQILFISLVTIYYSCIMPLIVIPIPLIFLSIEYTFKITLSHASSHTVATELCCCLHTNMITPSINYGYVWCIETSFLGLIAAISLTSVLYLPPNYLDMLHRCASHLGSWSKVEARNAHVPYHAWSELTIWQKDSLVKHVKGLFKASGQYENCAEPGNISHSRFYFIFCSPLWLITGMLSTMCATLVYEFVILCSCHLWNQCLTIVFIMFYEYVALFRVLRSWFVLKPCYNNPY